MLMNYIWLGMVCAAVLWGAGAGTLPAVSAAVMLGSTETTFYVVGVYFGAAGIRKTRHAIPAALAADLVGFIAAAAAVRWFLR